MRRALLSELRVQAFEAVAADSARASTTVVSAGLAFAVGLARTAVSVRTKLRGVHGVPCGIAFPQPDHGRLNIVREGSDERTGVPLAWP